MYGKTGSALGAGAAGTMLATGSSVVALVIAGTAVLILGALGAYRFHTRGRRRGY